MFESSQQEPSGGSTKTIGLVIVIGLVVLGAFYFLFMRREAAPFPSANDASASTSASATSGCAGPVDPDAKVAQDLVIGTHNLGRDQTQTMAIWSIQVSNRSRTACYTNIRYATTYSDGSGNIIYQNEGNLPGEIAQGDMQTFSGINDGLYPLATTSYTIGIKSADAHKAQ